MIAKIAARLEHLPQPFAIGNVEANQIGRPHDSPRHQIKGMYSAISGLRLALPDVRSRTAQLERLPALPESRRRLSGAFLASQCKAQSAPRFSTALLRFVTPPGNPEPDVCLTHPAIVRQAGQRAASLPSAIQAERDRFFS
jgi:hypothetical protein